MNFIKFSFFLFILLALLSCSRQKNQIPVRNAPLLPDVMVLQEAEKLKGISTQSDSLIIRLEKHPTLDTEYLDLLHRLQGYSLGTSRYFQSIYFARKLFEAAALLHDSCYMNRGIFFIGYSYNMLNQNDSALYYYEKTSDIRVADCDLDYGVQADVFTGDIYDRLGKYKQALAYHTRALRDITGNDHTLEAFYNCLALDYYHLDDFKQEQDWSRKAFERAMSKEDTPQLITALAGLSSADRGLKEWDSATLYSGLLYALVRVEKDTNGLIEVLDELGRIEYHKGNFKKALENELEAYSVAKLKSDFYSASDYSRFVSRMQEESGNWKQALVYQKLAEQFNDSLLTHQNTEEVVSTQNKARFEKEMEAVQHENEMKQLGAAKQLDSQRRQKYFFAAGSLLLILLSVFIYRNFVNQRNAKNRIALEEQRSKDLLHNILPEEVAAELKEKGSAGAKLFDDVTVLFTDFKEFTKASERLSPQQLVDELNACFSAFDNIVSKYSIEKIKTVGDAYLAVSGLPLANANHAETLVKAAIEIRDFMLSRRQELGEKTFEIRVGVHSGSVVAGIVGLKKFAYDIWGDTVNTAARMEQNSEAGKINISQSTYELIKDKFNCQYRGEIEAKNKGKLKMYFIEQI